MCSRSCTGVFSEPTYGLQVSCLQEPFCSCTKPQRFKTEAMIITKKAPMSSADILLNNNKLNVAETFKYLGVTVDSRLN